MKELSEAAKLIEQMQSELEDCLTTYAMPEAEQAAIMRLLREATLFRRKVREMEKGGKGCH
jgi:hypothetical protein